MTDNKRSEMDSKAIFRRLISIRTKIIFKYPFFGSLLMRLKLALADCETAATDMERVLFDPNFINDLTDDEVGFIMLHEVMHCALEHCLRSKGKIHKLYNIACDIVVNSNIIHEMCKAQGVCGLKISVAGHEPIHLTPKGTEGYLYTADQVYDMLMEQLKGDEDGISMGMYADMCIDDHGIWDTISNDTLLADDWSDTVKKAVNDVAGNYSIPKGIRQLVKDLEKKGRLNWKNALHDFIQIVTQDHDYSFIKPDKRYVYSDIILPSFTEIESEKVENIWFLVDTSGSISPEDLTVLYNEICSAIYQIENISGKISFFDDSVTEPQQFTDLESVVEIRPKGGGGTSFSSIFKYMHDNMQEDLPKAIIILTDGYCPYPKERVAMEIPVLWILLKNKEDAPWGTTLHI